MQQLLAASGVLAEAQSTALVEFETANALAMLRAAEQALMDGDSVTASERLQAFQLIALNLQSQVSEQIAVNLGVSTGFNASDGD